MRDSFQRGAFELISWRRTDVSNFWKHYNHSTSCCWWKSGGRLALLLLFTVVNPRLKAFGKYSFSRELGSSSYKPMHCSCYCFKDDSRVWWPMRATLKIFVWHFFENKNKKNVSKTKTISLSFRKHFRFANIYEIKTLSFQKNFIIVSETLSLLFAN